jgi:lactate permease
VRRETCEVLVFSGCNSHPATGSLQPVKASVAKLSGDRRLQAVLVAFCFAALIEGSAGFGAPVAISGAFLVGLGFPPFEAAFLCLIANTAPVAWGGIGIPILTLSKVTGLDVHALSGTCGRILPILSLVIPFWLVRTMTTWRETLEIWFPRTVIGGTFAAVQFVWSNYVGFELVDIIAAVSSMVASVIVVRLRRTRQAWRFKGDIETGVGPGRARSPDRAADPDELTVAPVARAWMPFVLLTAAVLIWGIPAIPRWGTPAAKAWLDERLSWKPTLGWLHLKIAKGAEATGHEALKPEDYEPAQIDIVPLSSTGTAVFLAACASGGLLGVSLSTMAHLLAGTVRQLIPAIAAILCMLALGFVTKYSTAMPGQCHREAVAKMLPAV